MWGIYYAPEHPTCGIPPSGRRTPSGVSQSYGTVSASKRDSGQIQVDESGVGLAVESAMSREGGPTIAAPLGGGQLALG
jgi:hypothetical protein